MPFKSFAANWRPLILMMLAGLTGFLLLWQLASLYPQATARILMAALLGLVIALLSRGLFRSRRIGLRTLVLVAPPGVAAICFPFTYVVENRRIAARLAQAGVVAYKVEPNGRLAETLGSFSDLLFDYQFAGLFNTELRWVDLHLSKFREDALGSIPDNQLMSVRVVSPQEQMLTSKAIAWLNDLPDDCTIELALFGLEDEEAKYLDKLEHDVHSLYVCDQILGKKALHSALKLAPTELSFQGVGFVANNSFDGAPAIAVELLRISNSTYSEANFVGLLNTTNPRNILLLTNSAPVSPQAFESVFSLQRLEGLSTHVPWLTFQHLEPLGRSESLWWASIAISGIPEEQFERLRTATPNVRINGKTGRPNASPMPNIGDSRLGSSSGDASADASQSKEY